MFGYKRRYLETKRRIQRELERMVDMAVMYDNAVENTESPVTQADLRARAGELRDAVRRLCNELHDR